MKDDQMAPCPGLLSKDGSLYFQARIPGDCLEAWQRQTGKKGPTYRVRLDTKDPMEARRIVREELWPAHYQQLDQLREGPRKTIAPHEVSRLVALMVRSSLSADEESREEGDYATDEGYARALAVLDDMEVETRTAISRRVFGEVVSIAQDWLVGHGYDIPEGSPLFRDICLAFAKGRAEVARAKRARNAGEWVDTPEAPAQAPIQAPSGAPMLSAVVASFLAKQDKEAQMFKKYSVCLRLFMDVLKDRPVNTIKQADIDGFFALLCKLPPRWPDEARKRGLGVAELAAMEWPRLLGPKTFSESYMVAIRLFLEEAIRLYQDQGFPPHLTTKGIKYSGVRVEGENKQRAMTAAELRRLFEGPEMAAFAADPEQEHCYWLPLVGLFTGARVNEVCQVNPKVDILEEEGVWCFHLTEETEGDVRIRKSLKGKKGNPYSRRKVPIHSRLLALGFLDYAKRMKDDGHALLFPKWPPSKGKASGTAEKWFRGLLLALGLRDETPGKRLVGFHAFRSTLLTRAYNLGVARAGSITGHAPVAISATEGGYTGPLELPQRRDILNQIVFDIDIPERGKR